MTTRITTASLVSPMEPASAAAPINTNTSMFLNWSRNFNQAGRGGFSRS